MCGIAAFSLVPGSKVNARALAHALLTQIENRGSHASGFAYVDRDGNPGIYKQPKPGSQLSLAEMPRRISSAILHTRYATQGPPSDNHNNHPVTDPGNRIAVVHNGVISNDHMLREDLGITKEHGLVDSLVIPALIAQQGIKGLEKLSGYASIAWIDGNEGNGVIRIAKLKQSPVAYTHLDDGSFVMASTPALLRAALDAVQIDYGGIFELAERRIISVIDGWIYNHAESPMMTYSYRTYQQYSGATAGGHGSEDSRPTTSRSTYAGAASKSAAPASTTPSTAPTLPPATRRVGMQTGAPGPVGAEATATATAGHPTAVFPKNLNADGTPKSDSEIYAELEEWRRKRAREDAEAAAAVRKSLAEHADKGTPLALTPPGDIHIVDPDDWDAYIAGKVEVEQAQMEAEGESCQTVASRYLAGEGFYIVDTEGDMTHYPTLDDLEKRLAWISKMGRTEFDLFQGIEDKINWVNHIMDLGEVDKDGNLESWVDDMAGIDDYESPAVRNLQYIREGAGRLVSLKGA